MARVLGALRPDVALLQEAPRLFGFRTSRALLARRTGLRPASWARAVGNLLLVGPGVHVSSSGTVLFPRRRGLHRRGVAFAEVTAHGVRVVLASTHLDLEKTARLDSAGRVRAALPDGPLVLGADVNEQPGGPAWQRLAAGLHDARDGLGPTFPAVAPRRHLDVVLTTLPVLSCEVIDVGGASDHLALLAELRL